MMIGTYTTDFFQFADTLNHLADPIELVALEPRVWLACSNAEKGRHANCDAPRRQYMGQSGEQQSSGSLACFHINACRVRFC